MPVQIEGGTGSRETVGVSPTGNRLNVSARADARLYYISRDNGEVYSWASGTYDGTTGDTVLLVKNTGDVRLYIAEIYISSDIETRWVIHFPTSEVTVAGTTIIGVNLNTGSSNVAAASAARDETGNSQGNVIWSAETQATSAPVLIDFKDAIILAKNKSIGVDIVGDSAACDVTIVGFFDSD